MKEYERREANEQVDQMCRKLLANPVIENFRFELEGVQSWTTAKPPPTIS